MRAMPIVSQAAEPTRPSSRATVVCVHVAPPRGVGTPRSVSDRASPWWVEMPSARSASTSSTSRCAVRSAASWRAWGGGLRVRATGRSIAPIPAQRPSSRPCGGEGGTRPLADQFPLLLRYRRVDPHHQVVRGGHVDGPDRVALLQQPRQRMRAPGDPVEARGDQHRAQLPAPRQRRLEPRTPVVLARGDVGEFRHQGPPLRRGEGAHARLLRLQPQTAVPLLRGRDPVEPDRVAWCGSPHQPASAMR